MHSGCSENNREGRESRPVRIDPATNSIQLKNLRLDTAEGRSILQDKAQSFILD
jgi:hypothetical protein